MSKNAILIGCDHYSDEGWPSLSFVANDINGPDGLFNVLTKELGPSCCYAEESVHRLIGSNATSENVETKLCEIVEISDDKSVTFIYFSGHGYIDRMGIGTLITYETTKKSPHKSGLTFEFLRNLLLKISGDVIVVIDACYSGNLLSGLFSSKDIDRLAIFMSCEEDRLSDVDNVVSQSLFTSKVVSGIRGAAKCPSSGVVTASSLNDYLIENFKYSEQKPSIWIPAKKEIILSCTDSDDLNFTGYDVHVPTEKLLLDAEIKRYIEKERIQYTQSKIYKCNAFLPIGCKTQKFIRNSEGLKFESEKKNEEDEVIDHQSSALNFIETEFGSGSRDFYYIAGDIGSGKSTLIKKLWFELITKKENEKSLLPIVIPLSRFRGLRFDFDNESEKKISENNFRAVFLDILQVKLGLSINYSHMSSFLQKVILIFDGLDEIGLATENSILGVLNLMCDFLTSTKIIITCRTHFISDSLQERYLFVNSLPMGSKCVRIELDKFTAPQVKKYIDRMSHNEDIGNAWLECLEEKFNIDKITRRPFLLELIISSNLSIKDIKHNSIEKKIYSHFVKGWMTRDNWRFSRFLVDYREAIERDFSSANILVDKKTAFNATEIWSEQLVIYFIELLSVKMRKDNINDISVKKIPSVIREFFPTMPEIFLNFFEYVLRTCSFLVRDEFGKYEFLHPSIHTYFTALAVLRELGSDRYAWDVDKTVVGGFIPTTLGWKPLEVELVEMLVDMLSVDDKNRLLELLTFTGARKNPNTLRYLTGNVLKLLSQFPGTDLRGVNLERALISGVDLSEINLQGANLKDSFIDTVSFNNARLEEVDIEGAQMYRVKFKGTYLKNMQVINGKTTISAPVDMNEAIDAPTKVLEIVKQTKNGDRIFFPLVADDVEMVLIEAGRFIMGAGNIGDSIKTSGREVAISSFEMDIHPVTNRQFKTFVEANPDWNKQAGTARTGNVYYLSLWQSSGLPDYEILDHPVVYVNWFAARAYAEWAGKRLATEAEWEFALRNKMHAEALLYPWGNFSKEMPIDLEGHLKRVGTYPVKEVQKNAYGLFDMSGNVNEWVNDWYQSDYWQPNENQSIEKNPLGAEFGRHKILRGGSFLSLDSSDFQCRFRRFLLPNNTNQDGGFRCVKSI